jgi:predicted component of type VI protein secretion system
MAYVIVYHKDQEVLRKSLEGPATIGRSPECELSVHDILLSRRHCRIEPEGQSWLIVDLGSKNGTRVGGNAVTRTALRDGDVIRMGKTSVRYRTGPFVPKVKSGSSGVRRPADPFEALAGTVHDFAYQPPPIATNGVAFPTPLPCPREPAAYDEEDVRSLVWELVSSSWDSVYDAASRPNAMASHAHAAAERAVRRAGPRPQVDLSLQAHPELVDPPLPLPPLLESIRPNAPTPTFRPKPSRQMAVVVRRLAPIFQWLVVLPLVCLK